MCSRTEDVDIISVTNYPEQSDHDWMIANLRDSYEMRLDKVYEIIAADEYITTVIEFNSGGYGLLTRVAAGMPQLRNYRLMDQHFHCVQNQTARTQPAQADRPEVSFNTQVGNIWEYEDVTPVLSRYKSDCSVVHYLSACPDDKITNAIGQICRVTSAHTIIIDYPPNECKVDIEKVFKEESPDYEIDKITYDLNKIRSKDKPLETIYHIVHPLP